MANLYRQITEDEGKFYLGCMNIFTTTTTREVTEDEDDYYLGSMNLFRQQIGNSISEIRTHFISNDTLNIISSKTTPHLAAIRDILLTRVEEGSFLCKANIVCVSSLISACVDGPNLPSFVVLMDSLALAMDFEISTRPSDVQCDVLLAICGQPVIVLTLVDGAKDSETVTMYNASTAKGVSSTLRKFMDETVNVVSGVLCRSDLDTLNTFSTSIQAIAKDSSLFVTLSTLEISISKYEKIVTAFWAGVAKTDATLLVCQPQDKNRLGSVFYNITTDADLSDPSTYTSIVDETRAVSGRERGIFWRFTKYAIDDVSGAKRRDTRGCLVHQLSHLQYGELTQRRLLDIVRDVNTAQSDYLERASNVVETRSRKQSVLVECPPMTLNSERVYQELAVSEDGLELVNTRGSLDQGTEGGYWGTCSRQHILHPPSPSTLTVPRYWETHSRVQVKGTLSGYEETWLILQMGVREEGKVDRDSFWSVDVEIFSEDPDQFFVMVGDGCSYYGEALTDKMSPTPGTDVTLIYGAVLDMGRGRLAFIDVNRGKVLDKFDLDICESLFPMFCAAPFKYSQCDVAMRLVSGREIAMTEEKKSLIATALYSQ